LDTFFLDIPPCCFSLLYQTTIYVFTVWHVSSLSEWMERRLDGMKWVQHMIGRVWVIWVSFCLGCIIDRAVDRLSLSLCLVLSCLGPTATACVFLYEMTQRCCFSHVSCRWALDGLGWGTTTPGINRCEYSQEF
jgi:hypothetical protein